MHRIKQKQRDLTHNIKLKKIVSLQCQVCQFRRRIHFY